MTTNVGIFFGLWPTHRTLAYAAALSANLLAAQFETPRFTDGGE